MLRFRRVQADDLDAVHRLHCDPATNVHNPYGATRSIDASAHLLAEWLDDWNRFNYGYELAFVGRELAGIAGARHDSWRGQPVQNLYWRLLPEFQGRGLSGVAAARAREVASRQQGRLLVVARMRPTNVASAHVAQKAGLRRRTDLDGQLDGFRWILYADRPAPTDVPRPAQADPAISNDPFGISARSVRSN